jgi:hypothetical protein
MNKTPDISSRLERHALALARAGMLAAEREFMDVVEPGWDDATPFEAELRRTRLVLDRASADLEVHFGDNDRVKLKAHPSGAFVWLTVRGDVATMTRRIEKGLRDLGRKVEERWVGEDELERRREAAIDAADRIVAELVPSHVSRLDFGIRAELGNSLGSELAVRPARDWYGSDVTRSRG